MKGLHTSGLVIFTDLDGTLLDHDTYSHAPAQPALSRLRSLGIPLVLASSKTAAEIAPLRADIGFEHCPAIIENGCGILEAGQQSHPSTATHQRLLAALETLPSGLRARFTGFSDIGADRVAELTGLPTADAANARNRQFSEPGQWSGTEDEKRQFVAALDEHGIIAQQGGRFLTLSFGGNKALRMLEIAARMTRPDTVLFTVALGDAANDVAMIEHADLGIIIPNPAHGGIPVLAGEAAGSILRASLPGPGGWNEMIMHLLQRAGKK